MKTNLNSLKEFSDEKKFWVLTAVFVAVYERIKVWNKNELFLSPMWRFHKGRFFYIQTMWTCFIKSLLRSALGCYSQLLVNNNPFHISNKCNFYDGRWKTLEKVNMLKNFVKCANYFTKWETMIQDISRKRTLTLFHFNSCRYLNVTTTR